MSNRFPHLTKANDWPGLGTVDPFDLQVTFDPYLWTANTILHLCNVKLDAEYRNVGGWQTKADRDEWFEEWTAEAVTLDTEFHILPGQSIKLPLAFELLNKYNYLYIDFPRTPTVDGNPETERYFYFVTDIEYRSPSATACRIILDEWTTHMHEIEAEYIFLEEGHAPIPAITPAEYFSSPIAHCTWLTVPDVNFGGSDRLQAFREHIVNQGPMWLVISMTADPMVSPGTVGGNDWRVPTTYGYRNEGAISPAVFAIEPVDATNFLEAVNSQAPQLMPTIQAVFLIPKRYVTVNGTFTFVGFTCNTIEPVQVVEDVIQLDETMFVTDTKYVGLTKLYTMPYSWLELVDENGQRQTLAIEETSGNIKVSTIASILFPFLGIDMHVIGIGINDDAAVTETWWDNLVRHDFDYYGDWTKCLRHYNIPTYMVLQNSEKTFDWTQHWQRQQASTANQTGYDLAIQNNNLNYNLRSAALDRQIARQQQQQANDTAQLRLGQTADNDVLAIMINKSNADLVVDKDLNSTLSGLTQQEFALAQSNADSSAAYTNAENKIALGLAHRYQDYVAIDGFLQTADSGVNLVGNLATNALELNNVDNVLLGRTGDKVAELVHQGVTDTIDLASTINHAGYANASADAGVATAQLNLWGAKQNAKNIHATYTMAMSNNATVANMSNLTADVKTANAIQEQTDKLTRQQQLDTDSLQLQQFYQTQILQGDVDLDKAQIAATKGMSDLSVGKRKEIQDSSLVNAWRAARLGSPKVLSQPSGSMTNYTRPQGLWVNVRMQDRGAIAAAGDKFLRDGYAMAGQQWHVTSWTPMRHFTRWKGDLQIGSIDNNESTRSTIHAIFEAGVRIWKDPSEIGTVSIYDNMPS